MLNTNKSIAEFNIIFWKSFKTYFYFNKLRDLLIFWNISNLIKNKKHYKNNNAISKNQLKKKQVVTLLFK